jgi:AraC family transcriptional regulator
MSPTTADRYLARFQTVLAYIDQHLDTPLSLAELGEQACFSPFHFARQFSALFGVSVYKYLQLLRLKRAAYQLAFRMEQSVTDIGFAAGYQNAESFSRAFRQVSGQAPSAFREAPDWLRWQQRYEPITALRTTAMTHALASNTDQPVELIDFPATRVAVLEHRGEPRQLGDSIRRFIDWRKANQLPPARSATFNLLYDNPEETPAAEFRFGLAAAIERVIPANDQGITEQWIPAGRCVRLRHVGSDEGLASTINYLYGEWLPASGEQLRDFPLFLQRVRFFPDVPEHEAVVDVYLPLK